MFNSNSSYLNTTFAICSSFLLRSSLQKNLTQLIAIRTLKEPVYPPLDETEIREIYTKGSGPGGQKVNKATNRCELKHLPTGIIVSSHDTRSLEQNRQIARKLLQQRLDFHFNKENSYLFKLTKLKQKERNDRSKRSVELLELKKEFKKNLKEED